MAEEEFAFTIVDAILTLFLAGLTSVGLFTALQKWVNTGASLAVKLRDALADGKITRDEWMEIWNELKKAGEEGKPPQPK